METTNSIKISLFDKLDEFINKYYLNETVKGINQFFIVAISAFLLVVSLEYVGRFNSIVRLLLFYGFISVSLWVLVSKVAVPLLKLFNINGRMSHEEAARIIGKHFSEVDDKLLNTVQLAHHDINNHLLLASIDQKIQALNPFDFKLAISKEELKKYFLRLAPVVLVLLLVSYINPNLLSEGSERVLQYNTHFAVPAPFDFVLQEENLSVPQNEDITVHLKLEGEEIPNDVHVRLNGFLYRMKKETNTEFSYTFKSLQKDQNFIFEAGEFSSNSYTIKTFPSPKISGFNIEIDFPRHTSRESESYSNTGDLLIPEGSIVKWFVEVKNCEKVSVSFDTIVNQMIREEDVFSFEKQVLNNLNYHVHTENEFLKIEKSLSYRIEVIPDEVPVINVVQDENEKSFYSGNISDDYGFRSLRFVVEKEGKILKEEKLSINNSPSQTFFHQFDIQELGLSDGEECSYYFIVHDNDAINGFKSASSKKFIYKAPSREEIKDAIEEKSSAVKDDAQKAMKELRDIQKEIDDFQKSLTEKKNLTWEDKNQLKDILERQKSLENKIQEMNQKNQEKNEMSDQLTEKEQELLKKQEQLEELFDEIFDEETKKLMEEIERMMEELNKEKLEDMMKQMEISSEDMEKELDRSLELFKQLEFDLKMEETIQELEKLAEEQKKLSEETENSKKEDFEGLKEKQEELNKKFEEVQKSLEELKEKNEALEEKRNMDEMKQEQENVKQKQQNASENLDNKKQNKASQNQKSASDQMKEMAQQMKMQQQQSQQQKQAEDMEDMRVLLDNLIELSHQQENVQKLVLNTKRNDPKYQKIKNSQSNIRDEAKLIEDSLFALSKRVIQLESTINKEMGEINRNLQESLDKLSENRIGKASGHQQFVMTSLNNLALIMDDILQQMQEQMKQQKFGEQSCSKPGSNNKPSQSQMQKQLNEQMKQLQEQMGQKPEGQKQGPQKGEMNQKLAKLAAEQAAIREELQRLKKELEQKKAGQGAIDNVDKAIEDIEKTERDLYNKNINPELLKRQQEILTRLLEAEEAEREQDWDDKRKSEEGKNNEESNPSEFLEYKRLREKELEQLKTVPLNMKPYYKRKASEYLNVNE